MQNIGLILLVFAFVFGCIASGIAPGWSRWHFGWLAVTFWIASELLGGMARVFHIILLLFLPTLIMLSLLGGVPVIWL